MDNEETKLLLFADNNFLDRSKESIKEVLKLIHEFNRATGHNINTQTIHCTSLLTINN